MQIDAVTVGGFSVIPSQNSLNMNQPMFFHSPSSSWCTLTAVTTAGLVIRLLDGSYMHGVRPVDVSNLGIQA